MDNKTLGYIGILASLVHDEQEINIEEIGVKVRSKISVMSNHAKKDLLSDAIRGIVMLEDALAKAEAELND